MHLFKDCFKWTAVAALACFTLAGGTAFASSATSASASASAADAAASAVASSAASEASTSGASASASASAASGSGLVEYGATSIYDEDVRANTEKLEQEYAPKVTTLADGTLVQRTPTEDITPTYDADAAYSHPVKAVPYNTYYLKADDRGCNSCHDDLAQLLKDMPNEHVDLTNSFGIDITVQMCIDCHSEGPGYQTIENSFGSVIHGIHTDVYSQCFTCHDATNDGAGMQMWDAVKHNELRGITDVSDVEGDFTYAQDVVSDDTALYDFGWKYTPYDYIRQYNTETGAPLDNDLFNNWTITITGAVGQEMTWTLPELIDAAGSETDVMTMQCVYNPTGGPLIGNVEVTGVPLEWLFETAGITDDAVAVTFYDPDGNVGTTYLKNLDGQAALLAYEINGHPLTWKQGYPVAVWISGVGAPANIQDVSDITVNTQADMDDPELELWDYEGWEKAEGGWYNKPNIGYMGVHEGQIITTGETFTFNGYAAAWDQNIDYIEFSMDKGVTWTRYDVSDTDRKNWITWSFAWTPEEDGAYVLRVRAVTEDGTTTEEPVEMMVNARSAE